MSRKLVFLPCLPWDSAALGDWANGLARDGLEPRRISAALPFLAVVGDGPACTYTVEPAHGAKRDGCRVPWVGSRIVRGRPAGKYPYGGARRRALNLNYLLLLFCNFALAVTIIGISDGQSFLSGEAEFSTLGSVMFIMSLISMLVLILGTISCIVLTIRVKYNRVCLTAFALTSISVWLWAISRTSMFIVTLI